MDYARVMFIAGCLSACSATPKNEASPALASAAITATTPVNDDPSFVASQHNPFIGAQYATNPSYTRKLEETAARHANEAAQIKRIAVQPTAVWLDSIESTKTVTDTLKAAAAQSRDGRPMLTVFVIYDLPNRDCSAKSSSGELAGDAVGVKRYQSEFIDPIAAQFAQFPEQRIVAIVEPDSLGNLATNMSVPKCAQSEMAYRSSIAYAVSKLALPNVSTYLDAAHAGWLGWNGNRTKIAHIFQEVLTQAGGADKIRGFSTNVSNYNTLSAAEGKKLGPGNPCPDELSYISKLSEELRRVGINNKQFLIDTARNGRPVRETWGNWCNIKGAGIGMRPVAAPAPQVDAYFWIKPPGESDGVADPTQPRYDAACTSADAAPGAPEAGQWFETYFLDLVRNAEPAI